VARTRADSVLVLMLGGVSDVLGNGGVETGSSFELSSLAMRGLSVLLGTGGPTSSSSLRRKLSSSGSAPPEAGLSIESSGGFMTNVSGSLCSSSSSKFQNCFSASHHSTTRLRLATARSIWTYQFLPCQSGWSSQALPMFWIRCTSCSHTFG
jgi:hypothetical protein